MFLGKFQLIYIYQFIYPGQTFRFLAGKGWIDLEIAAVTYYISRCRNDASMSKMYFDVTALLEHAQMSPFQHELC